MRKEFKVTKEMKENPNFNFTVYVYKKTNCSSVNEDSLEFYDEFGNLTDLSEAVEFSMSYVEEDDEDIKYIINQY